MTASIDTALVTQFNDMVHVEAEQKKSRMRGMVKEIPVVGNEYAYERLDNVEDIEITTRHADTVAQDITHTRRRIKMRDFAATLYLDNFDDLQTLINPKAEYAAAVARTMNRRFDLIALEAALATVYTGKNFGTSVSAATDGVSTISTGGTNLTYEKLLEIKENFINADVGVDEDEEINIAITGSQHTALMKEQELTSGDFNREYAIEKGKITKALGMNIILFEGASSKFLTKTTNTRDCIAFSNRGICVGINKDIGIEVNQRPDKNNLWQVQARFFLGGVRTEGSLIQKVQCDESA